MEKETARQKWKEYIGKLFHDNKEKQKNIKSQITIGVNEKKTQFNILFYATVTGPVYLNFLQQSSVKKNFDDEESYFQQDDAPRHYHHDVR